MKKIKIHFDGACKNISATPMPMGIGVAVFIDDKYSEKYSVARYVGNGTSNIAEWKACVQAMAVIGIIKSELWGHDLGFEVYSDSQLISRQYNGEYKIKEVKFLKYYNDAHAIAEQAGFKKHIIWIRREHNKKADELSKIGLKAYTDINKNKFC